MEFKNGLATSKQFDFESTQCCVCRKDEAEPLYTIINFDEGQLNFVRCSHCGLIYQNPRPTAESLANFFSTVEFLSAKESQIDFSKLVGYWDYFGDEPFRRKMAISRLETINKLSGGRRLSILKVGCGYGTFLAEGQSMGHQVTGVDTSKFFCAYGKHRYGVDIINASFEDVDLGENNYDIVLLLGVLQNLNDPRTCIEKAFRLLKNGGYLFINYQDANSFLIKLQGSKHFLFRPPVLNIFPKKSLEELLDMCDFKMISRSRDFQYTNLSKFIWFARLKFLWHAAKCFPVDNLLFKIPVPGGFFMICQK
jgi:2-polyprenyl-3-methyl-5-hydroxy-6-metoxy-1,4-benzoquinol methylase